MTDAKILGRPAERNARADNEITDSVDRETNQCPGLSPDKLFLIYLRYFISKTLYSSSSAVCQCRL